MYINDLNTYLKTTYGHKVYKLSLNGGMTCPNRDGTLGTGGCIFCSAGGSGDFASSSALAINEQIEQAKAMVRNKMSDGTYIAYFQAYTNTYGPVEYLRKIFTEAITHSDVEILSIATRPDCIHEETLELLKELNQIKPVWVELGLQTANEESAMFIRRGYENKIFENIVKQLISCGIGVIVHIIIGIPGESVEDLLDTVAYINRFPIQGVKLQLLHVLQGTDLAEMYKAEPFHVYSLEEYADILCLILEHLRKDIIIHRLTGDGPKSLLIEPKWSGNKKVVMNYIHNQIRKRDITQGAKTIGTGGIKCQ